MQFWLTIHLQSQEIREKYTEVSEKVAQLSQQKMVRFVLLLPAHYVLFFEQDNLARSHLTSVSQDMDPSHPMGRNESPIREDGDEVTSSVQSEAPRPHRSGKSGGA